LVLVVPLRYHQTTPKLPPKTSSITGTRSLDLVGSGVSSFIQRRTTAADHHSIPMTTIQLVINGNQVEGTMLELAQLVIEKTKSRSEIVFKDLPSDDPRRRCPDISLAKELLNWQPEVPLEVGIQYVIDWYKSQGAKS
jgi:nucleoside-diphosphate-sugar epimerase